MLLCKVLSYIAHLLSLLQPGRVDAFFVKKNGKGIMKENYNLVKSCQDTSEQLRLRMGSESQERSLGEPRARGLAAHQTHQFLAGPAGQPQAKGHPPFKKWVFLEAFPHKLVQR